MNNCDFLLFLMVRERYIYIYILYIIIIYPYNTAQNSSNSQFPWSNPHFLLVKSLNCHPFSMVKRPLLAHFGSTQLIRGTSSTPARYASSVAAPPLGRAAWPSPWPSWRRPSGDERLPSCGKSTRLGGRDGRAQHPPIGDGLLLSLPRYTGTSTGKGLILP